ncbi:MAG: hypothetical protein M3N53_03550 [Actinomycetota bacterium]|nr:hypothetical protein [Actinomycetota bacterium]
MVLIEDRSLDAWYRRVNRIYLDRNFYREPFSVFTHLSEVVGGLSLLASEKQKPDVTPESFVPKALAWWMALCGRVGVISVEELVWSKFPYVCPYCRSEPHKPAKCAETKLNSDGPDWQSVADLCKSNMRKRPTTLGGWQRMFADVYPVNATETYAQTFARFTEEMGELAEALRVLPIAPGYFVSEASDVFAWLMHLQELIYEKARVPIADRGKSLDEAFGANYPGKCKDCGNPVCTCPPILPSTLGRIAHDAPLQSASFEGRPLVPLEEAMQLFEAGARAIRIGDQELELTPALIAELRSGLRQLIQLTLGLKEASGQEWMLLVETLYTVKDLSERQRITQESIDELSRAIAALDEPQRNAVINFLNGMSSSLWASALIEAVKAIGT